MNKTNVGVLINTPLSVGCLARGGSWGVIKNLSTVYLIGGKTVETVKAKPISTVTPR